MLNFEQEARVIAKDIIEEWEQNKEFNNVVTIIQDYITDMDTSYKERLEQCPNT